MHPPGLPSLALDALQVLTARVVHEDASPWIPSSTPGKFSRPLIFLANDRGFVELLRMEPGTAMPVHRHTGEVHVFNVRGSRQLCTGERVEAGDYVYERAGLCDGWMVLGDEPLLALVVVMGEVQFLDADGKVCARASAATQRADYVRHCVQCGLPLADLSERE